jgi:hypothetical protein
LSGPDDRHGPKRPAPSSEDEPARLARLWRVAFPLILAIAVAVSFNERGRPMKIRTVWIMVKQDPIRAVCIVLFFLFLLSPLLIYERR